MKAPPLIVVAIMLLFAGCSGTSLSGIRPLSMPDGARVSPFEAAYRDGKIHLQAGRAGLAIAMFQKALAIEPNSLAALNASGAAYDELSRPDLAARYYEKALALAPNDAVTLNNIAVSLKLAGRVQDARCFFERAAWLDRDNLTIRRNLASLDGKRPSQAAQVAEVDAPDRSRPHLDRLGTAEFRLSLPVAASETIARRGVMP